jgi:tRNA(His) guanylyltransferase
MKDSLGDRMKSNYEDRYRISLPRRTNIIIRIDGKAFHSYTKGLKRPFDQDLCDDMDSTTKFLCENIQGAKMGYVQSDEISILITDYDDLGTHAWFDNNLQKMCSISASLATTKFNQLRIARRFRDMKDPEMEIGVNVSIAADMIEKFKSAQFDARVFVIPESEEVINYFIWRQQDATRNSISMAAQSMFSHKELQGKSSSDMQDMLMLQKGINWNDYPTRFKRGTAVIKTEEKFTVQDLLLKNQGKVNLIDPDQIVIRKSWNSVETPIFTQDREFILNTFYKKEQNVGV